MMLSISKLLKYPVVETRPLSAEEEKSARGCILRISTASPRVASVARHSPSKQRDVSPLVMSFPGTHPSSSRSLGFSAFRLQPFRNRSLPTSAALVPRSVRVHCVQGLPCRCLCTIRRAVRLESRPSPTCRGSTHPHLSCCRVWPEYISLLGLRHSLFSRLAYPFLLASESEYLAYVQRLLQSIPDEQDPGRAPSRPSSQLSASPRRQRLAAPFLVLSHPVSLRPARGPFRLARVPAAPVPVLRQLVSRSPLLLVQFCHTYTGGHFSRSSKSSLATYLLASTTTSQSSLASHLAQVRVRVSVAAPVSCEHPCLLAEVYLPPSRVRIPPPHTLPSQRPRRSLAPASCSRSSYVLRCVPLAPSSAPARSLPTVVLLLYLRLPQSLISTCPRDRGWQRMGTTRKTMYQDGGERWLVDLEAATASARSAIMHTHIPDQLSMISPTPISSCSDPYLASRMCAESWLAPILRGSPESPLLARGFRASPRPAYPAPVPASRSALLHPRPFDRTTFGFPLTYPTKICICSALVDRGLRFVAVAALTGAGVKVPAAEAAHLVVVGVCGEAKTGGEALQSSHRNAGRAKPRGISRPCSRETVPAVGRAKGREHQHEHVLRADPRPSGLPPSSLRIRAHSQNRRSPLSQKYRRPISQKRGSPSPKARRPSQVPRSEYQRCDASLHASLHASPSSAPAYTSSPISRISNAVWDLVRGDTGIKPECEYESTILLLKIHGRSINAIKMGKNESIWMIGTKFIGPDDS
ncbi:hypothetical protein C8R44DRAFT_876398 [Mycena epipterygia]|nr:hypothetical protein C8R44DRAFT_876398 [Mycena epipterygia]